MVKAVYKETCELIRKKQYLLPMLLTLVLSYGFMVFHPTIGIDDTASERFFQDGLEPYMGRWTLFLLNKILHFAAFAPLVTELVGVILFFVAVTMWCIVFKRVLDERIPIWGYTFFACIFVSSPILSEICTYYTHNGIFLAYCLCALGALAFLEGMKAEKKQGWRLILVSALCAAAAVGCYESMLFVYVLGIVMVYLLVCKDADNTAYNKNIVRWALAGIGVVVLIFVIRGIIVEAIKAGYQLEERIVTLDTRSLSEAIKWFDGTMGPGELTMMLKRYFLKYYLNAYAYLPIKIFVMATSVMMIYCAVYSVVRKNPLILLSGLVIVAAPWTMQFIEGQATPYRASQYIPLVCGFSVLLVADLLCTWKKRCSSKDTGIGKVCVKTVQFMLVCGLSICTFNQCTDMNKWFYIDYLKYEDAQNTMDTVAYELEKNYDTEKPVIFVGTYQVPEGIVKEAGLNLDSKEFLKIRRIADKLDEYLKTKYYTESGRYRVVETPYLSVIHWGINAFDLTNVELFRFWEMHGHSFMMETDLEKYEQAQEKARGGNMPSWPKAGYIKETDEYIIVKLGEF